MTATKPLQGEDRHPTYIAASVKQRLLDLARREGRVFGIVLVR